MRLPVGLLEMNVPGCESSREGANFQEAKIPHLDLLLPGANGLGSEESIIQSRSFKVTLEKDVESLLVFRCNFICISYRF